MQIGFFFLSTKLKEHMMKNDILPDLHMVMSLYRASRRFQSRSLVISGVRGFLEEEIKCKNGPSIKRRLYPSSHSFLSGDGILKSEKHLPFVEYVCRLKLELSVECIRPTPLL